jgi:tetratricopeptide (TPR) repeat protein
MRSQEFWDWYDGEVVPKLGDPRSRASRIETFRKMFEHLDRFDRPVHIVETGCTEGPDTWIGNGNATIIFDKYVECAAEGSKFFSVDIDQAKVDAASLLVGKRSRVFCDDSVKFLGGLVGKVHLLYLDASHLNWYLQTAAQVHHFNELMAIMPLLLPETLVVVDDSPAILDDQIRLRIEGKGGLVAAHAREVGAKLVLSHFQAGFTGFPGRVENDPPAKEDILGHARELLNEGNWYEAYERYRALLIRTAPPWKPADRVMHGEACAFMARLALKYDKPGAASDWFRRALEADPYASDYRIEWAMKSLIPLGNYQGARTEAMIATKIAPDDHLTWRALGDTEAHLGNVEACVAARDKQIALGGGPVAIVEKCGALVDLERYDEVDRLTEEMAARADLPDVVVADLCHTRAVMEARFQNHERAIELFKEALERGASDPSLVAFHLSMSLHSIGKYKEGWKYHAMRKDNRSRPALFVPMRRFDRPLFAMQDAPAVVHVHAESGAGDNISMWRYLILLAKLDYTVRYECRDELFNLARDSLTPHGIEVVPMALDYPGALRLKPFDYHIPVGELPHAFGTDIDTVPWIGPYVKADSGYCTFDHDPEWTVGIAWSAGVRTDEPWIKRYGELKSLHFSDIVPIVRDRWENFVSLQVGPPAAENNRIDGILTPDASWAETAALVDNLHLVITPDTGLAHLAGAMGKPTLLMMHAHNLGWHFMSETPGAKWNRRSPWYPSVLIYRQHGGKWDRVVKEIAADLKSGAWMDELESWPWGHNDKADDQSGRGAAVALDHAGAKTARESANGSAAGHGRSAQAREQGQWP